MVPASAVRCGAFSLHKNDDADRFVADAEYRHAVFEFMAEETVGNDEWYHSVYFGGSARDASHVDKTCATTTNH